MKQRTMKLWKQMSMMMLTLMMAVFVLSGIGKEGRVFAATPTLSGSGTSNDPYTYTFNTLDEGDNSFDVDSYVGSGSAAGFYVAFELSTEGDVVIPNEYGEGQYYPERVKHLKAGESESFRFDKSKFTRVTVLFTAVHIHDWDSETGKCKICGEPCTHDFSGGHDWCDICKWKCTHEKTTITNYYENHGEGTHRVIAKCDVCGKEGLEIGEENCTWELQSSSSNYNSNNGSLAEHEYKCSKCKQTKREKCSFDTVVSTTSSGPETHTIKTQCKCGNALINDVSHKWSGDTCSDCGFVRVQPGKIKGLKLKKVKSVKKKRWKKGYWDSFNRWHKGYYYNYYQVTYKVTFSKVKNAKYYEITYDSDVFIYNPETTKKIKSGSKITMNIAKKGNTYITLEAVSKTGNKSTYKKNFKYKNK
ncbi:MAG: hypothetical protein IJ167_03505 [Lachnospiraceae bacterium]|nr:hypothetical protein [Lachnospiraceae bacterium]